MSEAVLDFTKMEPEVLDDLDWKIGLLVVGYTAHEYEDMPISKYEHVSYRARVIDTYYEEAQFHAWALMGDLLLCVDFEDTSTIRAFSVASLEYIMFDGEEQLPVEVWEKLRTMKRKKEWAKKRVQAVSEAKAG